MMEKLGNLQAIESLFSTIVFVLNILIIIAKFLFLTPWGWLAIAFLFLFVVVVRSRDAQGDIHLGSVVASAASTGFMLYANLFNILAGTAVLFTVFFLSNAAKDAASTLTLLHETRMLESALANLKTERKVLELTCVPDLQDKGNNTLTVRYFAWSPAQEKDIVSGEETISIAGEKCYVDFGVINFDYSLIEKGIRKNLAFPHRVFSDVRSYENGIELSRTSNGVPATFSPDRQSIYLLDTAEYEREIARIADAATNQQKARKLGIRSSYGEAIAVIPQNGRTFKFYATGSGGVVLRNTEF